MLKIDGIAPGLAICFQIDIASVSDAEFVKYLSTHSLHIDVWDGDSLLYLGSSELQLKSALRQGESAVAYEDDLPITIEQVWTKFLFKITEEYRDKLTASPSYSSGINALAVSTGTVPPPVVCGTLHVRVVNIGGESKSVGDIVTKPNNLNCILYDYHSGLQNRALTVSIPKRVFTELK